MLGVQCGMKVEGISRDSVVFTGLQRDEERQELDVSTKCKMTHLKRVVKSLVDGECQNIHC